MIDKINYTDWMPVCDKCGTCGARHANVAEAVTKESARGWTFTRTFWSFLLPHRVIVECRECVFVSRTKYAAGIIDNTSWALEALAHATGGTNAKHVRELAWRFASLYGFDRSRHAWDIAWLSAVRNAAEIDESLGAIGVRQWTFDVATSTIVTDGKTYDATELGKRLWSGTPTRDVWSTIRAYFANGGRFPEIVAPTEAT